MGQATLNRPEMVMYIKATKRGTQPAQLPTSSCNKLQCAQDLFSKKENRGHVQLPWVGFILPSEQKAALGQWQIISNA